MQEIIGKEVVIVAGPSASGKSYLIRQLMTKRKSQLKDQIYKALDINPDEPRSRISIGALSKAGAKNKHSRKLKKELIFIHFDITSRHQKKKKLLLLSIAEHCRSIKVLTLQTNFEEWRRRMEKRFQSHPTEIPSNSAYTIYRLSKIMRSLAKWRYGSVYKQWAKLLQDINLDGQLIVNNEDILFKPKKKS